MTMVNGSNYVVLGACSTSAGDASKRVIAHEVEDQVDNMDV